MQNFELKYEAYKAMEAAEQEFLGMVQETIHRTRSHSRDELTAAAQHMTDTRSAFDRAMAGSSGSGPHLSS